MGHDAHALVLKLTRDIRKDIVCALREAERGEAMIILFNEFLRQNSCYYFFSLCCSRGGCRATVPRARDFVSLIHLEWTVDDANEALFAHSVIDSVTAAMLSDFIIYAISILKIARIRCAARLKFELKRPKRPEIEGAMNARVLHQKEIFSLKMTSQCSRSSSFAKVKRVFVFVLFVLISFAFRFTAPFTFHCNCNERHV